MINPDELLYSVDEHNNPIKPQPRRLSHKIGIWHRSCHIWIVNSQKEILCQQRSLLKDSNPGLWEPFFGGHLAPKQEYTDAAVCEVREELGLDITANDLQFFKEYRYTPGTEFQGIFILHWDGNVTSLHLEPDEVEQAAWKSIEEIESQVVRDKNKRWTIMGYDEELLKQLRLS
jgi:isopentenyldiphosphate isomerase